MKKEIFCTLGPKSLNRDFSKNNLKKVALFRLNLSHLNIKSLKKNIIFIRKYTKTPICIDTEGAQIRTKIAKRKFFKKGIKIEIFKGKKFILISS